MAHSGRAWMAAAVVVCLTVMAVPTVGARAALCQGETVTRGGTSGDDLIVGTSARDVIDGLGGEDIIDGGGGADVICGGRGDDVLRGGPGGDEIDGGNGADLIVGGPGRDRLWGRQGDDMIHAGPGVDAVVAGDAGNDALAGGLGKDRLSGGTGTDACDGGPGLDDASGCESVERTERGNRPALLARPPGGRVALTFDDGPDPRWTPQVLDLLAEYHVHATFFVIGLKAAEYPDLIRRMIREGHSVQNHTHSHAWLTNYSDAAAAAEIATGRDEVGAAAEVEPRCLRPPFGAISDRIRAVAAAEDQEVVMWDVDPQDWRHRDAAYVAGHVLSHTGGGDIVLLHDGAGPTAGRSLPAIIAGLRDQGLGFASICG